MIKAATLEHLVKYILFVSADHRIQELTNCNQNVLEEERNNVAHVMHVLFCTYRQFHLPQELFDTIIKHLHHCCQQQMHFILHYWLDNYAEDFRFDYVSETSDKSSVIETNRDSTSSTNSSIESNCSSLSSECQKPMTIADKLLSMANIDDKIYRKCLNIVDMKPEPSPEVIATNQVICGSIDPKVGSDSILKLDFNAYIDYCVCEPNISIKLAFFQLNSFSRFQCFATNASKPQSVGNYLIINVRSNSMSRIAAILSLHSTNVFIENTLIAIQNRFRFRYGFQSDE